MADWNSAQYLKFKNERTQPAKDLAVRINNNPKTIIDIGCGPGNSTRVLKNVFPYAEILGIDNSKDMIHKARQENNDIEFMLCDVSDIQGKYDLLFSNACLQWIPDHNTLIPLLMDKLNDDGILAVQIPMNSGEPLYKLIKDIASEPQWNFEKEVFQQNKTLKPNEYYNILSGCSTSFDMWEVKYYHTMPDHNALVEWVKSTRIRPYLDFLNEEQGKKFINEIVERSKELYPTTENDKVVFGFRRFFFTAVK